METMKGDVVEGKLCKWCRAGAGERRQPRLPGFLSLFRFSWQILGGWAGPSKCRDSRHRVWFLVIRNSLSPCCANSYSWRGRFQRRLRNSQEQKLAGGPPSPAPPFPRGLQCPASLPHPTPRLPWWGPAFSARTLKELSRLAWGWTIVCL